MTSLGKELRLRRLVGGSRSRGGDGPGNFVMIPMDHGVSIGPVTGVDDPAATARAVADGGATCLVVHKGLMPVVAPALPAPGPGVLVHLSASTSLNPDGNDKRLVATVEESVRLGADGISVHVNVGAPTESRMVEDLGRVATECDRFGMPLLAMLYPRGPAIDDPHDVDLVKHVARLGAELGADVVKCPYTGDPESFKEVVRGCPVPVVIAGGPRMEGDRDVLEMVHGTMAAGGRGVSLGRNAWQHPNVTGMTRAIAAIVLDGASVDDALQYLRK